MSFFDIWVFAPVVTHECAHRESLNIFAQIRAEVEEEVCCLFSAVQTTASAEEERNEESLFSIPAAFLLLFPPPARLTGRGRRGPGEGGGGKLINKEKKGRRKFPVYGARSPREEEERMKKKKEFQSPLLFHSIPPSLSPPANFRSKHLGGMGKGCTRKREGKIKFKESSNSRSAYFGNEVPGMAPLSLFLRIQLLFFLSDFFFFVAKGKGPPIKTGDILHSIWREAKRGAIVI